MTAEPLHRLPIAALGESLRRGDFTSESLTAHLLARIRALDPGLNAFVTLTEQRALDDARRADRELAAGRDRGPLHGVPYGLKDIFDTKGIRTTCQSRLRIDHVPSRDAVVVERLTAGGAVLLGKLATHEFAKGLPAPDDAFPIPRNPWDREHYTGGSSSGSGAAIAAGMMRFSLGSDTGGSIRGPSAYCGVVGLKPTYGLVSRRGVQALSYSLDHCGPMGRSIEDVAIVLQAIAAHDPGDPASTDESVPDYRAGIDGGVAGLRIGIPRAHFSEARGASPEVFDGLARVETMLREAGAIVEDVAVPEYRLFSACGLVIMAAESFAEHARDLRVRAQDYGVSSMALILAGAAVTGADLVQAHRVRRDLCERMNEVMARYDALLTLGRFNPAPLVSDLATAKEPTQSLTFNVTGTPALGIPIGFYSNALPMGVIVAGRAFEEAKLLRIGRSIERWAGFGAMPPAMP